MRKRFLLILLVAIFLFSLICNNQVVADSCYSKILTSCGADQKDIIVERSNTGNGDCQVSINGKTFVAGSKDCCIAILGPGGEQDNVNSLCDPFSDSSTNGGGGANQGCITACDASKGLVCQGTVCVPASGDCTPDWSQCKYSDCQPDGTMQLIGTCSQCGTDAQPIQTCLYSPPTLEVPPVNPDACPNKPCNDNDPCTNDDCDLTTHTCPFKRISSDICNNPQPIPQPQPPSPNPNTNLCANVKCNDANPCTDDICNPNTGKCIFTNDNNNACGIQRVCSSNTCDANNPYLLTVYPASGHDSCASGSCATHSCDAIKEVYYAGCAPSNPPVPPPTVPPTPPISPPAGECSNMPDNSVCGQDRTCPSNACDPNHPGLLTIYLPSGHDFCSGNQCMQYPCYPIKEEYSAICAPASNNGSPTTPTLPANPGNNGGTSGNTEPPAAGQDNGDNTPQAPAETPITGLESANSSKNITEEAQLGNCTSMPDNSACGKERICPKNSCDPNHPYLLLIYPESGHDTCQNKYCILYSCDAYKEEYSKLCEVSDDTSVAENATPAINYSHYTKSIILKQNYADALAEKLLFENITKDAIKNSESLKKDMTVESKEYIKNGVIYTSYKMTFTPKNPVSDFVYMQDIPKCLAEKADNISFNGKNYFILQNDPIIAWHFGEVSKQIEVSYEVEGSIPDECISDIKDYIYSSQAASDSPVKSLLPLLVIPLLVIVIIIMQSKPKEENKERK